MIGGHFDWIYFRSPNPPFAVYAEAANQRRHRFPARRGSKNHACAAKFLQFGCGVSCSAVDISIRTELLGERGVVRPAPHGCNPIAELLCELNSQMAKSADPLDGYEVARQRAAMAQGVKRGNASTHQRRGLGRV